MRKSWIAGVMLLTLTGVLRPQQADAQGILTPETVALEEDGASSLFFTLGIAHAVRWGDCPLCAAVEDDDSFTAHMRIGRTLTGGLGMGVAFSVWRQRRASLVQPADTAGITPQLTTMLGNASLSLSYQLWQFYAQAGAGLGFGSYDLEEVAESGDVTLVSANGLGVGYSLGGGVDIPVSGAVAVTMFGNWNVGFYDLNAGGERLAPGTRHDFFEFGLGLSIK